MHSIRYEVLGVFYLSPMHTRHMGLCRIRASCGYRSAAACRRPRRAAQGAAPLTRVDLNPCVVLCTGIANVVLLVPAAATAETSFPLECSVSYFFYSDYGISLVAHTWALFLQLCSLSFCFLASCSFFLSQFLQYSDFAVDNLSHFVSCK